MFLDFVFNLDFNHMFYLEIYYKKQKKIINETGFSANKIQAIARYISPEVIALF